MLYFGNWQWGVKKLDMILENKVPQNLKLPTHTIKKSCSFTYKNEFKKCFYTNKDDFDIQNLLK